MRKRIPNDEKRNVIIGIKTTEEIKHKLKFISDREGRPVSSQIYFLLEKYIENYFKENKIDWEEYK